MNTMDEQQSSSLDSGPKGWSLKARISRENTNSRRFSSSHLKNSNIITISSTASSPGYTIRDEIDPSTYSFTTALKALQAKTVYTWEYISSADGLILNSKWNEAEKYICNPLSGEVPLECLSAKTLSGRSFRNNMTSRITMSAPLIYPQFQPKSPTITPHENEVKKITIKEKERSTTRDVGIQSTPPTADISSGSPTPAPVTPSIGERPVKQNETETEDSSPDSSGKQIISHAEVEVKERGERRSRKGNDEEGRERKKGMMMICCMWRCCNSRRCRRGCLSFKSLWQKTSKLNDNNKPSSPTFLRHFNACYKE